MKLKDFQKIMGKRIFTTTQAHIVDFKNDPRVLNLQLHQWEKKGDLVRLKRGVYTFASERPPETEIARNLYDPCYFSLEYALSIHGIIPEAVFSYTLVTVKLPRVFKTPFGTFQYHKIKKEAFSGFDTQTLMAEKEKALVDYFYLNIAALHKTDKFWESSRLEVNSTGVNFKKVIQYAKLFKSQKLLELLKHFLAYAKSH